MGSDYSLTSLTDPAGGGRGTTGGPVSKPSGTPRGYVGGDVSKGTAPQLPAIFQLPSSRTRTPTSSRTPEGGRPLGYRIPTPADMSTGPTASKTPTRPSRTSPTTSNGKVPMSHCDCIDANGVVSIPNVIETIGGRAPAGLAKNLVLPAFMAEAEITADTGAVIDLVATTGAVWARDAQVQRVVEGQFTSRLWGMYINTIVLTVSGIQELLDLATITNRQLEPMWRSFQLAITPRNGSPVEYTLVGGVGIPRHGASGPLAAAAAVGPLQGPETWSLPSPVSFNATEVSEAAINYVPGTSAAPAQSVLNTGNVVLNCYFGGIMWKNDGTVIPPVSGDCNPAEFAAPVRLRASAAFKITR